MDPNEQFGANGNIERGPFGVLLETLMECYSKTSSISSKLVLKIIQSCQQ